MRRFTAFGLGLTLLVATTPAATAADHRVDIAAAANMVQVLEPLALAFSQAHPDIPLRFSSAATGNLVAQIRHGAPFEVLLSADPVYPRALVESGDALADTQIHFATGVLVLWPRPAGGIEALRSTTVRRIAIANPDTAPFGRAARTVLRAAGLWDEVQARLVTGENVAQTLHFVQSGNADVGFVAASLLTNQPDRDRSLILPVDGDDLHHTAVLLTSAADDADARTFLGWLRSESAQQVFVAHGFARAVTSSENPGIDE